MTRKREISDPYRTLPGIYQLDFASKFASLGKGSGMARSGNQQRHR